MRRLIITLGISFCLSVLGTTYAAAPQQQSFGNPNNKNTIDLYQSPELQSTVLQKLVSTEWLIPIYYKNGWIKVGDLQNGQVGWVNREQYHKAIETYYQPGIQKAFVCIERNGEEERPVTNVVAYKNGKRLSDKEAEQLCQDIEKQQAQTSRYIKQDFLRMNHLMVDLMTKQMHEIDQLVESF